MVSHYSEGDHNKDEFGHNFSDKDIDYEDSETSLPVRIGSIVIMIMIIIGLFSLIWYLYQDGDDDNNQETSITVISPDSVTYKEKPKNKGGMEFRHTDKEVYRIVDGNKKPGSVSRNEVKVASEDDKKLSRDVLLNKAKKLKAKSKKNINSRSGKRTKNIAKKDNKKLAKDKNIGIAKSKNNDVTKDLSIRDSNEGLPTKPLVKNNRKASNRSYGLQIGAFASHRESAMFWRKVSSRHADLLAGYKYKIIRADLAGEKVFYRLRLIGFGNKKSAQRVCKKLTQRKIDCFVFTE